ncbi:TonB-dependent siderophore receptor [Caulobacter sp. RL271]|uniref:TonB-dependent siderophore receptor n=1 Tax=Caulobacter segnis TaxID=88688 RepID=A0ABY4ZYX7_9CAUL|nr:TonB-dependent siderophore receptor [Caulobacter segnis]USQ97409.1 TonB-dependent siderophore receptor [Caulobacter segnis]
MPLSWSCASACLLALAAPDSADTAVAVEPEAHAVGKIVILGRRGAPRDLTLGAGEVTQATSPSSRSVERDLLDAVGAGRLADALELTSGVSQQNNRGGFMDNFAIRGFLGTPDGGAEYYVDGFLANRGLAPPRDPATAERIEILKGPAGALFGDIDPAGRVNIVSKTPRFDRAASVAATVGSFGLRRGEVDVTGSLGETVAGRLVVADEKSDGWRDHVDLHRRAVAPSLTWKPSDALRVIYVGEFTTFDAPFDRGVPAVNGDALALPRSRFYGEPGDGTTRFRNERQQLTSEARLSSDWTLTAGAAWREGSMHGFSSDQSRLVGRTLWRQRRERDYTVEDLSGRIELNGRVGAHRLGVGLKGYTMDYREKLLRRNPSATAPHAIDIDNPVYGGQALSLLPFTDNRETRKVATLYVQDLWQVSEKLSLVAGLRADAYRQKIRNNRTGAVGETKDQPVDYRLAARYRLGDAWTAHASYGRSFLLNSGTGRNGQDFAPEEGKGWELGLAGAWPGVDLAVTAFDIDKRNILANDPVDASFLAPVGRLTSKGVELDGAFEVTAAWKVVVNYAWTRARADDVAFATPDVLDVPEHQGGAFAVGRFDTGRGTTWSLTLGAAYVGDRAGALDGSGLRLPAYWKAKAALAYGLTPGLDLRLDVDNLFDAHYAQSSYSPVWVFPGAPRTVRATLRARL